MSSTWVEDPMQRPTFQQVLKELNSISPQKGDLMDNLVNMVRIKIITRRQYCIIVNYYFMSKITLLLIVIMLLHVNFHIS